MFLWSAGAWRPLVTISEEAFLTIDHYGQQTVEQRLQPLVATGDDLVKNLQLGGG